MKLEDGFKGLKLVKVKLKVKWDLRDWSWWVKGFTWSRWVEGLWGPDGRGQRRRPWLSLGSRQVRIVRPIVASLRSPGPRGHRGLQGSGKTAGLCSGGWWWPTVNAPFGGPVLARLTLGDLDYGSQGAESAKRDETYTNYDGPLATAWCEVTWPCGGNVGVNVDL